jgi:hypothetical protein
MNPYDEFGGVDRLIPVPEEEVDNIIADEYPDQDRLWSTTPEWFSPVVDQAMADLGFQHESLTMVNFWEYFDIVLDRIKGFSWADTPFARVDGDDSMVIDD